MIRYHDLRGQSRRRHRRLLAAVLRRRVMYVRREHEFRMAERLHRAGLVVACISKANLFGPFTGRPFRELAVFATEAEATQQYRRMLPRKTR